MNQVNKKFTFKKIFKIISIYGFIFSAVLVYFAFTKEVLMIYELISLIMLITLTYNVLYKLSFKLYYDSELIKIRKVFFTSIFNLKDLKHLEKTKTNYKIFIGNKIIKISNELENVELLVNYLKSRIKENKSY